MDPEFDLRGRVLCQRERGGGVRLSLKMLKNAIFREAIICLHPPPKKKIVVRLYAYMAFQESKRFKVQLNPQPTIGY